MIDSTRRNRQRRRFALSVMVIGTLLTCGGQQAAVAADGDLDVTFGLGGKVTRDVIGFSDRVFDMALQSDGKIVVLGVGAIGRFNADGSIDASFGANGLVMLGVAPNLPPTFLGVALQADGKIVIVGTTDDPYADWMIARLEANGTIDTTFGGGAGFVSTDLGGGFERAFAVAIQPDGRIVAVGATAVDSHSFELTSSFAVARYMPDGTLDTSFDGDGWTITPSTPASGFNVARCVAIQADGTIVVAGGNHGFAIARYLDNGALDTSFDGDGLVFTPRRDEFGLATGLAIQPDGAILATGIDLSGTFVVVRYTPDGALDTTFGSGGAATMFSGVARDVAVLADGRIIVAGIAWVNGEHDFGVVRLLSNGAVDATFGINGLVHTDFDNEDDEAGSMALGADGTIVLAGVAASDTIFEPYDWALARYTALSEHTVRFFLNGEEGGSGTSMRATRPRPFVVAPAYAMTLTSPVPRTISVLLADAPTWTSDATLTGTFQPSATFRLHLPCGPGMSTSKLIRVYAQSASPASPQEVGRVTHRGACTGPVTVDIPVTATVPLVLADQTLQVTISGQSATALDIALGPDSFLEATGFSGTP